MKKGRKSLDNFALFSQENKPFLLVLQVQSILVYGLLHGFTPNHARLNEFPTIAQLTHLLRAVEFLLESLQRAFDVVAFFYLNREHGLLIGVRR